MDPRDTPILRAVLTQASPSVSWEGATVTWTMLLPLVMVGAMARPVSTYRADSTARFGATVKVEAPSARASAPAASCFHSGHPHERDPYARAARKDPAAQAARAAPAAGF